MLTGGEATLRDCAPLKKWFENKASLGSCGSILHVLGPSWSPVRRYTLVRGSRDAGPSEMSEEIEPHVLERYDVKARLGRGAYGIVRWSRVHGGADGAVAAERR